MPIYEFRCPSGHLHDRSLPISSTGRSAPCPECDASATRLISAPGLGHGRTARARLIERTEASAESPHVVFAPPPQRHRGPDLARQDPRHAKLPRP